MVAQLRPAIGIFLLLTVITGLIYPLAITGIAQAVFPYPANGSLIVRSGEVIGSELIGQDFSSPKYFHPRPSAAGNDGYDPLDSGGSNLGPTSRDLAEVLKERAAQFRQENGLAPTAPLPPDVITASASGLDPDVSPEGALLQVSRVARARGLSEPVVRALVLSHVQPPLLGIFGEPTVNVLQLNLALDALK